METWSSPGNKLLTITNTVLFADDTSVIISSRNLEDFCSVSNIIVCHRLIGWLLIS